MTREIKFRAWNKSLKRMGDKFSLPEITSKFRWDILEVMQYTGLRDKSGVEIYEGDIVISKLFRNETPFSITLEDCFWQIEEFCCNGDVYEVIGNIHENPELLEN